MSIVLPDSGTYYLLRVHMVILTVILIKLTVVRVRKTSHLLLSWQHRLFDGTYDYAFI